MKMKISTNHIFARLNEHTCIRIHGVLSYDNEESLNERNFSAFRVTYIFIKNHKLNEKRDQQFIFFMLLFGF